MHQCDLVWFENVNKCWGSLGNCTIELDCYATLPRSHIPQYHHPQTSWETTIQHIWKTRYGFKGCCCLCKQKRDLFPFWCVVWWFSFAFVCFICLWREVFKVFEELDPLLASIPTCDSESILILCVYPVCSRL